MSFSSHYMNSYILKGLISKKTACHCNITMTWYHSTWLKNTFIFHNMYTIVHRNTCDVQTKSEDHSNEVSRLWIIIRFCFSISSESRINSQFCCFEWFQRHSLASKQTILGFEPTFDWWKMYTFAIICSFENCFAEKTLRRNVLCAGNVNSRIKTKQLLHSLSAKMPRKFVLTTSKRWINY